MTQKALILFPAASTVTIWPETFLDGKVHLLHRKQRILSNVDNPMPPDYTLNNDSKTLNHHYRVNWKLGKSSNTLESFFLKAVRMVLLLSSLLSRLAWSGILTCLLVVLVPSPSVLSPIRTKHHIRTAVQLRKDFWPSRSHVPKTLPHLLTWPLSSLTHWHGVHHRFSAIPSSILTFLHIDM